MSWTPSSDSDLIVLGQGSGTSFLKNSHSICNVQSGLRTTTLQWHSWKLWLVKEIIADATNKFKIPVTKWRVFLGSRELPCKCWFRDAGSLHLAAPCLQDKVFTSLGKRKEPGEGTQDVFMGHPQSMGHHSVTWSHLTAKKKGNQFSCVLSRKRRQSGWMSSQSLPQRCLHP